MRPAARANLGYALDRPNLGYAGTQVRDGCSKRKYGYVMDTSTRTLLQHIQNLWIRIRGNLSRCRNQNLQGLRSWTSLQELRNSRSQELKISKPTNLNEYPDLFSTIVLSSLLAGAAFSRIAFSGNSWAPCSRIGNSTGWAEGVWQQ